LKVLELMIISFEKCRIELQTFSLQDLQIDYHFVSRDYCYNLMLGSSKPAIEGECKDMVRMLLVVVSLVCQLRELVSIV
jgi:hypothetical protein